MKFLSHFIERKMILGMKNAAKLMIINIGMNRIPQSSPCGLYVAKIKIHGSEKNKQSMNPSRNRIDFLYFLYLSKGRIRSMRGERMIYIHIKISTRKLSISSKNIIWKKLKIIF